MVFRKPYAFLIKNFRKIHIVILFLWFFVWIKINSITAFVKQYISYGTYNASMERFSSRVGVFLYLALIVIIVGSFLLLVLLRKKEKPWKIYILYIFEYLLLLIGVILTSNFFNTYSLGTTVSGVLIYRDILTIGKFLQYPILILLIIRVLGIDIKKFNFKKDEEYLELSSEDREEFEISFDFDKNSIIRLYNRTKRNLYYFYKEHTFICNILIVVSSIYILYQGYYFFAVTNRSYKQGKTFKSGMYEITVKDSYITDKDLAGNKIEEGYNFVVLIVNIKNTSNKRVSPNLDRYHLMNGGSDYTYKSFYNSYFTDIGEPADGKVSLYGGKSREMYLVFRVKEKLRKNRFVLYYQELGGKLGSHLRKVKLKMTDVSEVKDTGEYKIGDEINFDYIYLEDKKIRTTSTDINTSFSYNRYFCPSDSVCATSVETVSAREGKKILKISFSSSDFEGEEFIDFSTKYGRIKYKDSKGRVRYANIVDAIGISYQGRDIFIMVDSKILDSSDISILYTLRNKRYTLKIK